MSGVEAEADLNRKQRRARPTHSAKEQRLAQLMAQLHDEGRVPRHEGESNTDYFTRLRDKAQQILRHQRRLRNRAARASRKRNR